MLRSALPCMRHRPACGGRGFTLIQLMIYTTVLAILCGIGVPALQQTLVQMRADALRMQLVTVLNNARNTAISRRMRIDACATHDGRTCSKDWARGWLIYPGRLKSDDRPLDQTPLRAVRVEYRGITAPHTGGRATVQFRPDGRMAGLNQTIRICVRGVARKAVKVNIAGRVRSVRLKKPERC